MITIEETTAAWRVMASTLTATTPQSAPVRPPRRTQALEIRIRAAGSDHQVVTLEGGPGGYRRKPCQGCPWRKDTVGSFPSEAFVHSASTAYDMATHMFGCHESGTVKPATCAGFLLRGADHNLAARIGYITGKYKHDISSDGLSLHVNYRAMAVANGVDPNHPALEHCR
jgi:hypothetical protein